MAWTPASYNGSCYKNSCDQSTALFLAFLVQYFGKSYDELFNDINKGHNDQEESYDFIIVGAGSAGCVVANRLSEVLNWKILLLEAGDEEPLAADVPGLSSLLQDTNIDYGYLTNDTPALAYTRGKVMGGSSSVNAMWYVRGNKEDYNNWARYGNDGWSWEEVLPYFKMSENARDPDILADHSQYHGTGGYLTVENFPYEDNNVPTFIKAFREIGFKYETDYNTGNQAGVSRVQFSSAHGTRLSSNGAFLRPIRGRRSNLIIKPNARVTKIIIDEETKRTQGVEYELSGRIIRAYAKKEVIVSAGAIDSPKLLLLSGIGPAKDLQNLNITVIKDLPVGLNLHDHVRISRLLLAPNGSVSSTSIETRKNDLINWLSTHEGPWSVTNLISLTAFHQTKLEKTSGVGDIQYLIKGSPKDETNIGPYFDNFDIFASLLKPKSRGYLKLDKTDPRNNQPEFRINLLSDPRDAETLVEGLKITRRLMNSESLKNAGFVKSTQVTEACKDIEFDSDGYLECLVKKRQNALLGFHAAGTCKMGPKNDDSSVVDPELKVRGIRGLRVIDASIMPDPVRGSIGAPIIMIAEKGSDLIKKDYIYKYFVDIISHISAILTQILHSTDIIKTNRKQL